MSARVKIRIRGLRKAFGAKIVLDGVDLDVPEGRSMVVIGGSGTGKSVLLKCVLGLIRPDAGVIEIDGVDVVRAPAGEARRRRSQIGMLFQNGALFDSMPVWENVCFGLLAERRMTRRAARARAVEILAKVGLGPEVAGLAPSELSGGMQKRVALARAVAAEPAILFFDEPTTGLDPIMGAVIDGLINDTVRGEAGRGATALAITHDMASAQRIGDRAAMLYDGRIAWEGEAESLLTTDQPLVHQFTHGLREGPITMSLRR